MIISRSFDLVVIDGVKI